MRRLLLVPFLLAACSGASEDEAAQDEDALSTMTIAIDGDLPLGFEKDFDRTFSTSLVREGGASTARSVCTFTST
jgi:hypothetical protein